MRVNDAAFNEAIDKNIVVPVILFELLTTPPVRVHSAIGDIIHNGETYTGVGEFAGINTINESQLLQPERVTVELAGFPTPPGVNLDDIDYKNKRATLTMLLFNKDTQQRVGNPLPLFAGEADVLTVSYGRKTTLSLTISNELVSWKEGSNRIWSHTTQQAMYPGDLGFQYLTELEEKEVNW